MTESDNKYKKLIDVADTNKSSSPDEPVGKLNLKDGSKYDKIVSSSLESFGAEEESSQVPPIMAGAEEVKPWSIRTARVFGTSWFNILVFFFIGNVIYSFYMGATAIQTLSGVEAERERSERLSGAEEDLAPFRPFLSLSPAVSDGDYSSFIRAFNALNSYFPAQGFDRTALFVESGFVFHPGGLSYIDPE